MQRILLLILCLAWSGHTLSAQRTAKILAAEQARFQAMTTRDSVGLPRLLHSDLIYLHSNGLTETRRDFVASVASGRLQYHQMEREGTPVVARYGRTGLISGVVHATGVLNGTPFDIRLRYTSVYRRSYGHWQLLRWQSARI